MKYKRVHFVGIGGAGMSGLAKVLAEMGKEVSGSDLKESRNTLALKRLGIKVFIGHRKENIKEPDLVVYSSAIPKDNIELKIANKKGIPLISRAGMVAELSKDKELVAVSGTHGKTTTTSMISLSLKEAGLRPTFLIGGELNDIGSNASYGEGKFFVTEADESDGSFLLLSPKIAVVTNVEADHLDYYGSLEKIREAFSSFLKKVPASGCAVLCGDDPYLRQLKDELEGKIIFYGLDEDNSFTAKNIRLEKFFSSFEVYRDKKRLGKVSLKVPGIHNVYNALATVSVCEFLGISFSVVKKVLSEFSGVKRRFEVLGFCDGAIIVDDYAHHPTEIRTILKTAKKSSWERVICVFQPHRYSRTKFLCKDFGKAFSHADMVVLTDVYSAGEEPIPGVSGKLILDYLLEESPDKFAAYLPRKDEVKEFLKGIVRKGDLVLTVGAGDIHTVGEELVEHDGRAH